MHWVAAAVLVGLGVVVVLIAVNGSYSAALGALTGHGATTAPRSPHAPGAPTGPAGPGQKRAI